MSTVHCRYYNRVLPAMRRAPWPGELGQRLLAEVSQQAWSEWLKHQTLLINEHRLSALDPKARELLAAELERFFYAGGAAPPKGYVEPGPENG